MGELQSKRVDTPLVSELSKLIEPLRQRMEQLSPGRETQELNYISGYSAALSEVIRLARVEELRVRNFIKDHDGTCLDSERERMQFIHDLYGPGSRNNNS
jgi:hypothetical protein